MTGTGHRRGCSLSDLSSWVNKHMDSLNGHYTHYCCLSELTFSRKTDSTMTNTDYVGMFTDNSANHPA